MSFSNNGVLHAATANAFSLTPTATTDFLLIGVICTSTTTSWPTTVTATNMTWAQVGTHLVGTNNTVTQSIFKGTPSVTSAANQTIGFNTGTPALRIAWQEFSNTGGAGVVTLDNTATVDTTLGGTFPSITPAHGAGELYWCFAYDNGVAVNGSTSGYVYQQDANSNIMTYNTNCTSSAQAPNFGDSGTDGISGIAAMFYENVPAGSASVPIVSPSAAAQRAANW